VSQPTPEQIAISILSGLAWSPGKVWDDLEGRIVSAIRARDEAHAAQLRELVDVLNGHKQAVEGMRVLIADLYPDGTRSDSPYYDVRSHMAAVLRSLDELIARAESRQTERVLGATENHPAVYKSEGKLVAGKSWDMANQLLNLPHVTQVQIMKDLNLVVDREWNTPGIEWLTTCVKRAKDRGELAKLREAVARCAGAGTIQKSSSSTTIKQGETDVPSQYSR